MRPLLRKLPLAAALACALPPLASHAVTLNPDGLGQALIYPYYTVQSDNGNAWNTYITVVNHTIDAKAVRVRIREGRNARAVASFNLFLSPNDEWTAALIQSTSTATSPARLVTGDTSCTSPTIPATSTQLGIDLTNTFYSGFFADGFGEGLDRTREGFIEIIEMGTLTGFSAASVTHNSAGVPANCLAMQGVAIPEVRAPSGGLSGTLTVINVTNGMDFNANAEALAELSTQAFYRHPGDAYPDFNASEIEPVSTVVANGKVYRSSWTRPIDAVSAVFMRSSANGEFVLDRNTRSRTDHVMTFPTRSFYVQGNSFAAPFEWPIIGGTSQQFSALVTDRKTLRSLHECEIGISPLPPCRLDWAWATSVLAIDSFPDFSGGLRATSVLGSGNGWTADRRSGFLIDSRFENGAITYTVSPANSNTYRVMTSQGFSTRMDMATGQVQTGAHTFRGLPLIMSTFRTFENGTLTCSAGACQGNYGGSFPGTYQRNITP